MAGGPIILRAARRELAAARRWYEERDPEVAARFAAAIAATFRSIIAAPERSSFLRSPAAGARFPKSARVRRAFVRDFPYVVLFDVTSAGDVRMIAIAHQARKPGYWRTRIRGDG